MELNEYTANALDSVYFGVAQAAVAAATKPAAQSTMWCESTKVHELSNLPAALLRKNKTQICIFRQ